jgi:hypothetical protein
LIFSLSRDTRWVLQAKRKEKKKRGGMFQKSENSASAF